MDITLFQQSIQQCWSRSDLTLYQHVYEEENVIQALKLVGFQDIVGYDANSELEMSRNKGRKVFLARKNNQ